MKKSILSISGQKPVGAILALFLVVFASLLFQACQNDEINGEDMQLKTAVIPQLTLDYPDEACLGEEFTITYSSTCGKVMIERGYINGDPIYENDLIVDYEKVYAGLTCETEGLKWEYIGNDGFMPCAGGVISETLNAEGTYVYRAKLNKKAYKGSVCPDCTTFKGNLFECFMVTVVPGTSGTFTDVRDGQEYNWVKIGDQVWMAENLAYQPETGNSWAYNNVEANVAIYGRLYDWATAKTACPAGWHLPSDAEWTQLAQYVSDQMGPYTKTENLWANVGKHLKSTGTIEDGDGLWRFYNAGVEGTDDFGFSGLPGGYRYVSGTFSGIGGNGYWWSSTEFSTTYAWCRLLRYDVTYVGRGFNLKDSGFSVRCVRD